MESSLQRAISSYIMGEDGVGSLFNTEAITMKMKEIIESVSGYKITAPKSEGQRWSTYVPDPTKFDGRRKVAFTTEKKLLTYLWDFYGLDKNAKSSMTFAQLWDEFISYKKQFVKMENKKKAISPSTIRKYERDYGNYISDTKLDNCRLNQLTGPILETYVLEIIKDNSLKERCASNVLGYICQTLEYAYRSDYIEKDLVRKLDRKLIISHATTSEKKADKDRILNATEMKQLLKEVRNQQTRHPKYCPNYAIELATVTGMRVGELATLKWEDIKDGYIDIVRSEHRLDYVDKPCEYVIDLPKNGKTRQFPLSKSIENILEKVRVLELNNPEGYIFCREDGSRCMAHDISCAISRRADEANLKGVSIHGIRRTVSSELRKVLPVRTVANMLGHLEDTNEGYYNYDTLEMNQKRDAIEECTQMYSEERGF